ncbi:peptidoglycan/LPS O-acetylase OafA/YrhL [Pedobacter cryoconitis]|uniref:acyltransferase family protein n=1 Tax=Pedobacter cryoconitis TaxID=188932 RepID=UPI00160BBAE0|nr:acyltransferase [Pedobacter cryoconitis]MBB6273593.1 peptidoglycan/LPS O-acetylase OafA/YrhL [Pedobacter cryoconitis]
MKHLPNLYPLRFLLSIVVVIFHLPLICKTLHIPYYNDLPIFSMGPLAVLYFFSLSGFLILRLIYFELTKTKDFDFKNFYSRRIKRLYPVYYLVFLIGLVVYHVMLPAIGIPYKANYNIVDLILNYVFIIPNVFAYNHQNVGSILIILWSIGVEEQFYLFIPIFMYAFRNKVITSIIMLLGLLLLLLLLWPSLYVYSNYYFYFLFGGLLSILSLNNEIKVFKYKGLQIVIYTLFIFSFTTSYLNFENKFLFHLFNMIVSGLLISFVSDYPLFIIKNKIIDHLGKISYGIYMYHMIIITGILFLTNKFKPYDHMNHTVFILILNLVVMALTICAAHLSFKYFESRFYKTKIS